MKTITLLTVLFVLFVGADVRGNTPGDSAKRNTGCPYAKYQRMAEIEFNSQFNIDSSQKKKLTQRRRTFKILLFSHKHNKRSINKSVREGRLSRCFVK